MAVNVFILIISLAKAISSVQCYTPSYHKTETLKNSNQSTRHVELITTPHRDLSSRSRQKETAATCS